MFGLGDFSILAVYGLCILSALACIVYGIINWNKGGDEVNESDKEWSKTEKNMAEKLDV